MPIDPVAGSEFFWKQRLVEPRVTPFVSTVLDDRPTGASKRT